MSGPNEYCPLLMAGGSACDTGAPMAEMKCQTAACAWWSWDSSECIVVRGVREGSRQMGIIGEALAALSMIANMLENLNEIQMRGQR